MTNLGRALIDLGTISDDPDPVRRGIRAIDAAMEIFRTSRPQEMVDGFLAIRQHGIDWLAARGLDAE
jgi:hypothetical protein